METCAEQRVSVWNYYQNFNFLPLFHLLRVAASPQRLNESPVKQQSTNTPRTEITFLF